MARVVILSIVFNLFLCSPCIGLEKTPVKGKMADTPQKSLILLQNALPTKRKTNYAPHKDSTRPQDVLPVKGKTEDTSPKYPIFLKDSPIENSPECKTYFFQGIKALEEPKDSPESFLCPQTKTMITWTRHLKDSLSIGFEDRAHFLRQHPLLPSQERLQRLAEKSLTSRSDEPLMLEFFKTRAPLTAKGALLYASLLLKHNKQAEAHEIARNAWRRLDFQAAEQLALLTTFKHALSDVDHKRRTDYFFIQKKYNELSDMLRVLPQKLQTLVRARLAVAQKKPSMPISLALVAKEYKHDKGLLYERIRYLNTREEYSESFKLISQLQTSNPDEVEAFFQQRHLLAREALKERKLKLAFQIASEHGIENSEKTRRSFSTANELCGWISLVYLKEADQALAYYIQAFENYKTAFSRSKSAFYASLCALEKGNPEEQKKWLEKSAEAPASFYGQLALYQLKKPLPDYIPITGSSSMVQNHPLISYGTLLGFFEQSDQAGLFFQTAIKDLKKQEDYIHFANLITKYLPLHNRVFLFKMIMKDKHILFKEAYPIPANLDKLDSKNLSVFLGLMLQESNFNEKAVSSAGAIGISQLMPKTAEQTAKKMKMNYTPASLMTADYNSKIGNFHFNELLDFFTSSLILSTAAYNAGKAKVLEWVETYGDPRAPNVDKLAFIQQIPYTETRSYVEFVLGNYMIYKNLLEESAIKKAPKKSIKPIKTVAKK